MADEAFRYARDLTLTLRIVGPLDAPRIVFDAPAITAALRDALVAAGKRELAERVGGLVGDKLPPGAAGAVEQGVGAIGEGLGGLFGPKPQEKKPPPPK
ncbi:MAG: hypothetical protein IPM64_15000 [Phycisphaerales bacterium]|nr:hypothetical protein [Phycisphaerales bacterium]